MDGNPEAHVTLPSPAEYHLGRSLTGLRMGRYDPSMRVEERSAKAARLTPEGPVTLAISHERDAIDVRLWGPGSDWFATRLHEFLGLHDRPGEFRPDGPVVPRLIKRYPGLHLVRATQVFTRLVQVVLLQLVTSKEAMRAWSRIVERLGRAAPGPIGLRSPPTPEDFATTSVDRLQSLGVLPKQGRTIVRLAREARRIEAAAQEGNPALAAALRSVPGIGPWSVQYLMGSARGDPDAVMIGDYHLPNRVAWNLAGEPRGTDERMLELLEPFRGDRYRVVRMLWIGGSRAPRRGPRRAPRDRFP